MDNKVLAPLVCGFLAVLSSVFVVRAEDPYLYYTWTVTYGTRSPLGVPQQVCFTLNIFYILLYIYIY